MICLVGVRGLGDRGRHMPDEVLSHLERFLCEFSKKEVRLEWDEVYISDGHRSFPPKPGVVFCSGVERGVCPVEDARGHRDWSKCPRLPFAKR